MTPDMKYSALFLVFAFMLILPANSLAETDKALHFGLSAVFGAAGESVLHHKTQMGTAERIVYGTIIGSLPGLAKEIIDSGRTDNHFSGGDMAANIAGALIGAVVANVVNNRILISVDRGEKKVSVSMQFDF